MNTGPIKNYNLGECITLVRGVLSAYEQGGWKVQAKALLKQLRDDETKPKTFDDLRSKVESCAASCVSVVPWALGFQGRSNLKSELEAVLKRIPTSAEYSALKASSLASSEVEKLKAQLQALQMQQSDDGHSDSLATASSSEANIAELSAETSRPLHFSAPLADSEKDSPMRGLSASASMTTASPKALNVSSDDVYDGTTEELSDDDEQAQDEAKTNSKATKLKTM